MSATAIWTVEAEGAVSATVAAAAKAGDQVLNDRLGLERDAVKQLQARLVTLRTALQQRLNGPSGVTDFRRFVLSQTLADVEGLFRQTQAALITDALPVIQASADLGDQHAEEPVRAVNVPVNLSLPGLDAAQVTAAFENTATLLSQPMQQFRDQVMMGIRRVALAGDSKEEAITQLTGAIAGEGFANADFRAERILRTELARVFNLATYQRLQALGQEFPFLRKGWKAANDSRTRLGHRQASQQYARGHGIPMGQLFEIKAYDERPGKPVTLIGVATLRFPLDPMVKPDGSRAAKAATIMCRCNAFVDFDLQEYGAFITKQVGGLDLGQPAETSPVPPPALPKPRKPRAPKVPQPLAIGAGPATVQHAVELPKPVGPQGPKVSRALRGIPQDQKWRKVQHAMDLIDQVHGDGELRPIPFGTKPPKGASGSYTGQIYGNSRANLGVDLNISAGKGLVGHPINTMIHEVGHWLDQTALELDTTAVGWASGQRTSSGMQAWVTAARESKTMDTLRRWRDASKSEHGTNGIPSALHKSHIEYLISLKETWARSYAQYVALRSGDVEALSELRLMQAAVKSSTTGVPAKGQPGSHYDGRSMGTYQTDEKAGWQYPVVWQDEEFEPIAKAIDQVMGEHGWRK